MGRQPPGSRLDRHRCRVRGRAATPRADAHRLAGPTIGRSHSKTRGRVKAKSTPDGLLKRTTQTRCAVTSLNGSEPAAGREPPGSRLDRHRCRVRGRAATPRADAHRLAGPTIGRSRSKTRRGVKAKSTPDGLLKRTTQTHCAATSLNGSEPAVGRQPPGSRLDRHRCRVRGRAVTPRADAHRLAGPTIGCWFVQCRRGRIVQSKAALDWASNTSVRSVASVYPVPMDIDPALTDRVLAHVHGAAYRPGKPKQIAELLGLDADGYREVRRIVKQLVLEGPAVLRRKSPGATRLDVAGGR